MPVKVVKRGNRWEIVEIATGRIVGHSTTARKAHISAWKRNKAHKAKQAG
jgi:hypothetical protein